jgi:gamma-glutamylcyclotransferase (GGCT)/AIG2-like uncharacterized protein YtfP
VANIRPTDTGKTAGLFVYGTLKDPSRRRQILGRSATAAPARLENHKKCCGKYPYLVKAEGHQVHGWIVRDLTERDFARLDDYEVVTPQFSEGAMRRLYRRQLVQVMTVDGRSAQCWIYMANSTDWPPAWR